MYGSICGKLHADRRLFYLTTVGLHCGSYAQTVQFCVASSERRALIAAVECLIGERSNMDVLHVAITTTLTPTSLPASSTKPPTTHIPSANGPAGGQVLSFSLY
jgi:hypothetical protein